MLEYLFVTTLYFWLMEVVHIELTDKRRKIIMLKVLRKYPIAELLRLLDDETIAITCPCNNLLSQRIIDDLKQLHQKRRHVVYRLVFVVKLHILVALIATLCAWFTHALWWALLMVFLFNLTLVLLSMIWLVKMLLVLPFNQLRLVFNFGTIVLFI